ncbi:unknown protein [Simkania negevensis Z]|uniref:Uncharacterized protein n=1 Tax=Simkania negevensis (strain ATCC VR-1471 / DSM 27360 / Z) TaxID=331113 RepID=F8L610_SIMNZ|nr:unknown protein [Simkania negevensis Z]
MRKFLTWLKFFVEKESKNPV